MLLRSAQADEAAEQRAAIAARLDGLLGADAAVLVPSAPGPAPRLRMPSADLDAFRARLIALTSPAGLAGLPQARRCSWVPQWCSAVCLLGQGHPRQGLHVGLRHLRLRAQSSQRLGCIEL